MPSETPKDPAQMFQEWVTNWERATDNFSNKLMGTDEFSKYLNKMQGAQLEFQKGFGELMTRQLANLNMPSRDDVLRLSEEVRGLDRRMARMEASLQKLTEVSGDSSGQMRAMPPRTKKAPGSISD